MLFAFQFVAAFGALVLTGGVSAAQLPVAPPPHPTLDELVKEYKRLGLPIPSPKVELVRGEWKLPNGNRTYLALRHPAATPGDGPHYQTGAAYRIGQPVREEAVKPVPTALEGAPPVDGICFVVQCKLRGYLFSALR